MNVLHLLLKIVFINVLQFSELCYFNTTASSTLSFCVKMKLLVLNTSGLKKQ